jgi:hypothetical protein
VIFRRVRKIAKSEHWLRHVSLSAWYVKLGSDWADFREIWYLNNFRKSVEKIKVSLKWDKNNGYFTWRPIHIFITSHSILLRKRQVSDKLCGENQNTHFKFNNFISYNRAFYEIMWKNIVEPGKPRWQYGACAFYVAYLRLQTLVAIKRFNVTSYVYCLSCLTSVSTQELQLLDPLAHWYRLFKIRATTKWIDCSTSELFPLFFIGAIPLCCINIILY